jgi:hypothetical protein
LAISVTQFDQDYYPGRRKRGKDYREDMVCPFALKFTGWFVFSFPHLSIVDVLIAFVQLELPFFYPGQVPLKLFVVPSLFSNLLTVPTLIVDKLLNVPHTDMSW